MDPTKSKCLELISFAKEQAEVMNDAASQLTKICRDYTPVLNILSDELEFDPEDDTIQDVFEYVEKFEKDLARVYLSAYEKTSTRPYPHATLTSYPEIMENVSEDEINDCEVVVKWVDGKLCVKLPLLEHRPKIISRDNKKYYKKLAVQVASVSAALDKFISGNEPELSALECKTFTYFFARHNKRLFADNDNRAPWFITDAICKYLPGGTEVDKCAVAYKGFSDLPSPEPYTLVVVSPGLESVQTNEDRDIILQTLSPNYTPKPKRAAKAASREGVEEGEAGNQSTSDYPSLASNGTTPGTDFYTRKRASNNISRCLYDISYLPTIVQNFSTLSKHLFKAVDEFEYRIDAPTIKPATAIPCLYNDIISKLSSLDSDIAYELYNLYKHIYPNEWNLDYSDEEGRIYWHEKIGKEVFGVESAFIDGRFCFIMPAIREHPTLKKDGILYRTDYTRNLVESLHEEMITASDRVCQKLKLFTEKTITFFFVEPTVDYNRTNETKDTKGIADALTGPLPGGDFYDACTFFFTSATDSVPFPYTVIAISQGCDSACPRDFFYKIRAILLPKFLRLLANFQ